MELEPCRNRIERNKIDAEHNNFLAAEILEVETADIDRFWRRDLHMAVF